MVLFTNFIREKIRKEKEMSMVYRQGDVIKAAQEAAKINKIIIPHVCNNRGGWGAGFVVALSKTWPEPENAYRKLPSYELGDTQFVEVEENLTIANMIAQDGFGSRLNPVPLSYMDLNFCLEEVFIQARDDKAHIYAPMFGCGLAGGDWTVIEKTLQALSYKTEVPVFVYRY
jgi:hypothetical protein